jgi:hypothetical protein
MEGVLYNEQLAFAILHKLNEALPASLDVIQLMKALPEFSTIPRNDWMSVLEALEKLQRIKGNLVWAGLPRQILRAFNLEITQLGQSYLEQSNREREGAHQGVTTKMGKRAQSPSPGGSTPPTIQPHQAIPLLREQIRRLEEVMKLHHDDPMVDAWESTTENILNAVYGLPNGEMHPNTFNIIKHHARGTLWYVGMRDEDSQRRFVQSQQTRKALLEACIEQLEILPLAAPSPEEGTRGTKTTETSSSGKHELIMGDKYEVHGQAGAVGPQPHMHDVTFVQIWDQSGQTIDLTKLAEDLSTLRQAMLKESAGPEHYAEVGAVASAEIEAKNGNGPQVLQCLSKAGKWAFDIASKIGAEMAVAAIKKASGL